MFYGKVEKELLEGEPGFFGTQPQLPFHLQLLVDEQQKGRDIWELPIGLTHQVRNVGAIHELPLRKIKAFTLFLRKS